VSATRATHQLFKTFPPQVLHAAILRYRMHELRAEVLQGKFFTTIQDLKIRVVAVIRMSKRTEMYVIVY
jgi:hypothetical protein